MLVHRLALAALAAAAVSCTKPLDTSELQTTLERQLEAELGTTGLTVSCPTDVEVRKGGKFDCSVSKTGSPSLRVEITQTDEKGNVTWKVVGASTPTPSTPTPSM